MVRLDPILARLNQSEQLVHRSLVINNLENDCLRTLLRSWCLKTTMNERRYTLELEENKTSLGLDHRVWGSWRMLFRLWLHWFHSEG